MNKNRTPLRYPGGKQKISLFIKEILELNNLLGGHYVEPYAGGAGVAIDLLLNDYVTYIHLNDISVPVYAFWHSIVNNTEEFCRRVSRATLSVAEWKKQREIFKDYENFDSLALGFATFYLNRCNRSGILTAGLIGGLNQDGAWKMDARFSRNDLIGRIEAIADKKKYIKLKNWDAEKYFTDYIQKLPKETLIYCDPPYIKKANTLYENHYCSSDHIRISKLIQKNIKQPWIVSYDNDPLVLSNYQKRNKFIYKLSYSAAKVYKGSEIFVFSDKLQIPTTSVVSFIDNSINTNNS